MRAALLVRRICVRLLVAETSAVNSKRYNMIKARNTLLILLLLIYTPIAYHLIDYLIPSSLWFKVDSVEVENTTLGKSPKVIVKRSVRRSFLGARLVSVRRIGDDGYALFCVRTADVDFLANTVSPPDKDLDWWLNIPANPPCPILQPGRYFISFTWTLNIPGFAPKFVRMDSNVFEVSE